jgi:putative addiction module antidote
MIALKIRKIGNSEGATFPRELLAAMHVSEGDTVFVTEAPDGFRLTPYDPEFKKQMELAHKIAKKRRNAYRELARR